MRGGGDVRATQPREEFRICNSEVESVGQEGVGKRSAGFDVVNPLHVGHVRAQAWVGQFSLLVERRRRTAGNESRTVRKHVSARVVIELVLTDESAERKKSGRADQAGPPRGEVKSLNLRPLILGQ